MCKAHILRFSCSHGVLMSLEPCKHSPCPVLRNTGVRLPQQPTKCYNCQAKAERGSVSSSSGSSRNNSCRSSQESLTSASTLSSSASSPPRTGLLSKTTATTCSFRSGSKPSISYRTFSFSCSKSDHTTAPHYTGLPEFLPHQDHSCPPCQLEEIRTRSDTEVVQAARDEYPNLKAEMLVRDGRIWEEWQGKPSLEKYIDEKRTEDREMWLHVTRKWTQDLRKSRVLVSDEDGLGLMA